LEFRHAKQSDKKDVLRFCTNSSFGAHQAEFAQAFGGLGGFNCDTCTPLKGG
jgi:hypothetical protein